MKEPESTGRGLVPVGLGTGVQVSQTGNQADGHIAARDVNAPVFEGDVHFQLPPRVKETALGRLYRKLSEEAAGDALLTEYIAQLQIFTRVVQDEEIQGLDGKFVAADREDQLDMAMAMKEMIYGELRENMFSKTFQTIYATLMGKIHDEFQVHIRPAIVGGANRLEIDVLVNQKIVQPIVNDLEDCQYFEGVATSTVRGMMYFLTGNCHLVWHKAC